MIYDLSISERKNFLLFLLQNSFTFSIEQIQLKKTNESINTVEKNIEKYPKTLFEHFYLTFI